MDKFCFTKYIENHIFKNFRVENNWNNQTSWFLILSFCHKMLFLGFYFWALLNIFWLYRDKNIMGYVYFLFFTAISSTFVLYPSDSQMLMCPRIICKVHCKLISLATPHISYQNLQKLGFRLEYLDRLLWLMFIKSWEPQFYPLLCLVRIRKGCACMCKTISSTRESWRHIDRISALDLT